MEKFYDVNMYIRKLMLKYYKILLLPFQSKTKKDSYSIFNHLEEIAEIIPIPMYWIDREGRVSGANSVILAALGVSFSDVSMKKIHEFHPKDIADHIVAHNDKVMELGKKLFQEEWIRDFKTGEVKYFTAVKTPLYDNEFRVIGMLGTSTEITAEKKLHLLQLEMKHQQIIQHEVVLKEKEKLITLAHTVAHDISSPLSALNMMMHACGELKESKRLVIKRAIESILDIANNLLSSYRSDEQRAISENDQRQPVLVSDLIMQLLSEKKAQYSNHVVRFETEITNDAQFAFALMQASQFRRSMSNLINNAVDALANKEHDIVTIKLTADAQFITVAIQDNGKGMPSGMIEKMLNRQSFTDGKQHGHGIGLQQVWDTLDTNQGKMTVSSTVDEGTTIQLTFPRIDAASWIAQTIHLVPNSIVVILDDEESIHGAWDTRFVSYLKSHPTLAVHHFKQGQEALDFFSKLNSTEKDRVVFLSDFELLRQQKNGLQIIEESGIKNAVLVTSYYANSQIRDKAIQLGVKILPKQMASIVPIEMDDARPVSQFFKAMRNRFSTHVS
jgi:PAS domain S-box-containing protein